MSGRRRVLGIGRAQASPTIVAIGVLWVVAIVSAGIRLGTGQGAGPLAIAAWVLGVAYIVTLAWWLAQSRPRAEDLPHLAPREGRRLNYRGTIWATVLVILICFALGAVAHPQLVLILALTIVSLALIARHRSRLTWRMGAIGLAIGAGAILLTWATNGADPYMMGYLATMPILFMGGALLAETAGLGRVRLLEGDGRGAWQGFLLGAVLSLPPALLNLLGGAYRGDTHIQHFWDSLAALVPGVSEEVWARLLLTTLIYGLLRPVTNPRPRRALSAAILIAALTHSLAHLPTLAILSPAGLGYIVVGLAYGVPMGLLYAKRDLETAVGYHFFIDFLRFLAALVLT